MGLILLFLTITAFVLFFYGIGLWYLGFIPLVFFVVLIAYYTTTLSIKEKTIYLVEKHGMLLARLILLGGIFGVFNFLGVDTIVIAKILFSLNLILWITSYLLRYRDGKLIFQVGYYLSLLFLFISSIWGLSFGESIHVFTLLWGFQIAIMAFFIFIIGIGYDIERYLRYRLFILLVGVAVLAIVISNLAIYTALFLSSGILMLIYFVIHRLNKVQILSKHKQENISLRRILAGERILAQSKYKPLQSPLITVLAEFVHNMPKFTKYMLEAINILLVALLVFVYIQNIGEPIQQAHQLLFWIIIIIFTGNVILLKKIGFTSFVQKILVFTIINFAIYASLFTFLGMQFGQIATRGIVRNIASSLAIFYSPKTSLAKVLVKRDYMYWIGTTVIALIINIILLSKAQLEGQLVFSLVFLYIGLEGMILFYAMKYIRKLHR